MDTSLQVGQAGKMQLLAFTTDRDTRDAVIKAELYFGGIGTGVTLTPTGDGVFVFSTNFGAQDLPVSFRGLLEVVASDHFGNMSELWPYLTVVPCD